jgi:hypothetical protein
MIKYARFINREYEVSMERLGYHIIPGFLNDNELAVLSQQYRKYHKEMDSNRGFWFSVEHLDKGSATEFSELAIELLKPKIDEYFTDAFLPIVTMLDKYPNDNSNMDLHRDCSAAGRDKVRVSQYLDTPSRY